MLNHKLLPTAHPLATHHQPNEITLQPGAAEIFRLFGTNVLPVNPGPGCDTMRDVHLDLELALLLEIALAAIAKAEGRQ